MDVCAAPGNKSLHLLDILIEKADPQEFHNLLICEKDKKRGKLLMKRLVESGCKKVEKFTENGDTNDSKNSENLSKFTYRNVNISVYICSFFDIKFEAKPFSKVEFLNLDPSCSGSGLQEEKGEEISEKRVKDLSILQIKLLKRAVKFPNLKSLCYSTCSVFREENQNVVFEVLKTETTLRTSEVFSNFETCENGKFYFTQLTPEKDNCRGFFLCKLVKKTEKQKSENLKSEKPKSKKRRIEK
jgi:putative methyltransferase